MKTSIIIFLTIFSWSLAAQAPPNTNIYLFDLVDADSNDYKLMRPTFLTKFNSSGYNLSLIHILTLPTTPYV